MTPLTAAPDFEPALGDLQDHLPDWWRSDDPASSLYQVLTAISAPVDELSVLWEQPYLDQVITTASEEGLRRNFAFAYGLLGERLSSIAGTLRAYIQARAAEDGSIRSMINTLLTLVGPLSPGGPLVTFPMDGSGLTFPSDGSGITLYEYTTIPQLALRFPVDGSGLTFPADGSGLPLSDLVLVDVIPNFAEYRFTVRAISWLHYDRRAFRRAVERFRPADWLEAIITPLPLIPAVLEGLDGGSAFTSSFPESIDAGSSTAGFGFVIDGGTAGS